MKPVVKLKGDSKLAQNVEIDRQQIAVKKFSYMTQKKF